MLSCALALSCGSGQDRERPGSSSAGGSAAGVGAGGGGAAGSSPLPDSGGATAGGASAGGAGGAGGASTCPSERPPLAAANTAQVTFAVEVQGGGRKVLVEEARAWTGTQLQTVTTFSWFLAAPRAKNEAGAWVTGQLIREDGNPAPYGVALFRADAADSSTLRIALPPGTYRTLELGVGVPADCNAGDPTTRVAPLDTDSGMYWSWGTQYMFARLEGNSRPEGGNPTAWFWHAGLNVAYSTATLEGAFSAAAGSRGPGVRLDLDFAVSSLMPNSHGTPSETAAGGSTGTGAGGSGGASGSAGAGGGSGGASGSASAGGGSGGPSGSAGTAATETFEETYGEAWLVRGIAKHLHFE